MAGQAVEEKPSSENIVIVTAGRPRSGKSTALNNIIGSDFFRSSYSASSVTKGIITGRVEFDNKTLIVVDTPGLGSADVPLRKVKKELQKHIGGLKYVLVYCYSIAPSCAVGVSDELVVKNLQSVLGKDVWEKCVVLFTSSDLVRKQAFPKVSHRDSYKVELQRHAANLSKMMRKCCGSHVPEVAVIFDCEGQDVGRKIVAVPVGLKFRQDHERHSLVPGRSWVEVALTEIKRKGLSVENLNHVYARNDTMAQAISTTTIAIGAAGGAFVGGAVGFAAGGVGAIAGGVIGAVAGGVAGGVIGGPGGLAAEKIRNKKIEEKVEHLKAAQLIQKESCLESNEAQEPAEVQISTTSGDSDISQSSECPPANASNRVFSDALSITSNICVHSDPEAQRSKATSATDTHAGLHSAPPQSMLHSRQLPVEVSVSVASLVQADSVDSKEPVISAKGTEREDFEPK